METVLIEIQSCGRCGAETPSEAQACPACGDPLT
jgi:ribosomal protein L40E